MIAVQMMMIFFLGGGVSPKVVKGYSDVSEEVTACLFRVTRTL